MMGMETFLQQTTSTSLQPKIAQVRVWDLPTRLFHWLLALGVIGLFGTAWLDAIDWHMRIGCAVLTLLLWRLIWGFIGGHWSRFASFIYSPAQIWAWARGKHTVQERAYLGLGHNPLGALSIWAMLFLLLLQVVSGLMADDEISYAGPWVLYVSAALSSVMTFWHTTFGKLLVLLLALLHMGAIFYYRFKKKENLVTPMLLGDKALATDLVHGLDAPPASRDDTQSRLLALALLLVCVALVWWATDFAA
jgi:cytochrome b